MSNVTNTPDSRFTRGAAIPSEEVPHPGNRAPGRAHDQDPLPVRPRNVPAREAVGMAERLAKAAARDHAGLLATHVHEADPVVVEAPPQVGRMTGVRRVHVGSIGKRQLPVPERELVAAVPAEVIAAHRVREGDVHLAMTGPRAGRVRS